MVGEDLRGGETQGFDLDAELLKRGPNFRMGFWAGEDYARTGQAPKFLDDSDFVIGFESGRTFGLTWQHPNQTIKVLMHRTNADMAANIGLVVGREVEYEERDENWFDVSFIVPESEVLEK